MKSPAICEFEPFCKWHKEEERDILEVHLQGFKKEQLRVQINNLGILIVSGERRSNENITDHFHKEVKISNDFNTNGIRAKFRSGILYLTIPKKIQQRQENEKVKPQINQDRETENPTGNEAEKITAAENGRMSRVQLTKFKFGLKSSVLRLKVSRTAVKAVAVVAVAVVVALGAYATYNWISGERS